MTQSLSHFTWVQENFHSFMYPHHTKEAAFACSSPRPDFRPSPVPSLKQIPPAQGAKRKRDGEDDSQQSKRIKQDATLQTPPKSVTPPQQFSSSSLKHSATSPGRQDGQLTSSPRPTVVVPALAVDSSQPQEQSRQSGPPASARIGSITSARDAPQPTKPSGGELVESSASIGGADARESLRNRVIERMEAYLNLRLLEKHEELRLAETEQAKCQITLEQLRRVHLVPYERGASKDRATEHVITGTGPAVQPSSSVTKPPHPSPFGVADGPYTRHYARWLLQDEAFDSAPPRMPRSSTTGLAIPPRKRMSIEEQTPARIPKRSSSSQNQQLPTVSIDVDGVKTLAAQRPDGEWVKVVCKKCGKRDAANLQGFTNHTRISHNLSYANHKEAIHECGQALDEHEAAQVAEKTAEQHQQQQETTTSAVSTPLRIAKPNLPPLALGGGSKQSLAGRRTQGLLESKAWRPSLPTTPVVASPVTASTPNSAQRATFARSPNTSKLLSKAAQEGVQVEDFNRMVNSNKEKINLDQVPSLAGPEDEDDHASRFKPSASMRGSSTAQASRVPARAPVAEPSGCSNATDNLIKPKPAPLSAQQQFASRVPPTSRLATIPNSFSSEATASFDGQQATPSLEVPHEESPNYSPRTIDTNPGLVSDHDDDSDGETHYSEHGGDVAGSRREPTADVRVSGQQYPVSYEPAFPYGVFHQTQENFQAGATPPSQKKKRGRPRKNEQQPRI